MLAIAYHHSVLLTDYRITPTGRRQSIEGPDTGPEGWWGDLIHDPHRAGVAFDHYLEPTGSIGRPQIDWLRQRQTFPFK